MRALLDSVLARLRAALDLRDGEGAAVAWASVTFFAVLGGYFVLRPVRDALVLDGDPAFIPWLWTATFVAMTAIAPPWGALVARWPRRTLVPIIYRAFAIQMLVFAALVHAEVAPAAVGKVFYVWLSVYNLFVVSVFWSLCADVSRPDQGRRLFGPIAAGGTAGAFVGPLVTKLLVDELAPAGLLVIGAVTLEAAVWCAAGLDRASVALAAVRAAALPAASASIRGGAAPVVRPERPSFGVDDAPLDRAAAAGAPVPPPATTSASAADAERARHGAAVGGSAFSGIARLFSSPYLLGIAGYVLLLACLGTFVYLRQAELVKAALPDRSARTAFFADVDLYTSVVTMAIQFVLTARLLRWFGAGAVLAVLPVVQGVGAAALEAAPGLTTATAVSASSRAVTHALSRPARELLFTALPRDDKYKAKNVIDTFVHRFGDFASAWLHAGLVALGIVVASVAVPLAGLWAVLAIALGLGYRRRVRHAPPH